MKFNSKSLIQPFGHGDLTHTMRGGAAAGLYFGGGGGGAGVYTGGGGGGAGVVLGGGGGGL